MIDPAKGDATGYLAKYIAKNIDGAYVGDDEELPPQQTRALCMRAFGPVGGIRTFQQIGGAPVGVWRELPHQQRQEEWRTVGPPAGVKDPRFEAARYAADNAIFRCYLEAMGGNWLPKTEHPIAGPPHRGAGQQIRRRHQAPGILHTARLGIRPACKGKWCQQATYEAAKAARVSDLCWG